MYMALSRTLIRTYAAEYDTQPEMALSAANRRIREDTGAALFVTVFYGVLDPTSGELTYANAGHNPPCLLSARDGNAVQELDRCRKAGLVGVTIWMIPPDKIPFDTDHYERFWSAAEDLEMPVSMHINNGLGAYLIGRGEDGKEFRVHRTGWSNMDSLKGRATEHKQITADALTDIIVSGALGRHPRLKVVVAEVEVGWIPFWLEELDKRFKRRGALPMLPSEYFYRQVFSTFTEDPVGGLLLSRYGADNFMWSNDYPHNGVGDIWLFSGAIIERDLGHLSAETRAKALRETVAKLYGKTIPALMTASTASDPTLEAWREERAGFYAGIS